MTSQSCLLGFKRVSSVTIATLTVILASIAGLTQAGRIAFCWTTEHRLPPQARLQAVDGSPSDVFRAITEWVEMKGGKVVDSSDRYPFTFKLEAGAGADFEAAKALVQPLWNRSERGQSVKLKKKKLKSLQDLTEGQITRTPSAVLGYRLLAKMNDRTRTYQQQVKVGEITMPGVSMGSIMTKSGSIVTLKPVPIVIPQFETRTNEISFHSQLEFFVFSDGGVTEVYVVGTPATGSMRADYGHSIGSDWWTEVNGVREASLVPTVYDFISSSVVQAQSE